MITFIGALALCFAQQQQQKGGGDWSQGFPDEPAKAQPAKAAPAPAPAPAPTAAPPPQAPPPAVQAGPPVQAPPSAPAASAPAQAEAPAPPGIIDAESTQRHGTELSPGALASAPYLYFDYGRRPGEGKVARPKDRDMYQRFDNVHVKPAGKQDLTCQTGDTVDVLRSMRRVKIDGYAGYVVSRTGRGVVIGFAGRRAVIRLIDVWGKVSGSERVAKAAAFAPLYSDHIPVVAEGPPLKATVIMHLNNTVAPYMHQYLIVDKGASDGVKLGDFFRVADRERPKRLSEELIEAQVVSVSSKASVLVIQKIYRERLSAGDEAFLSFRAAVK